MNSSFLETFQRVVDKVVDKVHKLGHPDVDNTLVYSESFEKHMWIHSEMCL